MSRRTTRFFGFYLIGVVAICSLSACKGATAPGAIPELSGSKSSAHGLKADGTPTPTPSPTPLPVLTDTNPSTANLFLGAVCDVQAEISCPNFANVERHGIAVGTVYTDWSRDLGQFIQLSNFSNWVALDITPCITWMPYGVTYDNINAGVYDKYLIQSAREAKAFGSTLFIRPFHEFNGTWYPWSLKKQGNGESVDIAFKEAWIRMVNIFRHEGATNVRFLWVFSTSAIRNNQLAWNDPANVYPGDNYVDWVGFDVYNRGSQGSTGYQWRTFDSILLKPYNLAVKIAPNKPITIAEIASNEYGDGGAMKAGWISQMVSELTSGTNPWPHVRLLSWFEADHHGFLFATQSSTPVYTSFVNDIRGVDQNGVLLVRSNGAVVGNITSP